LLPDTSTTDRASASPGRFERRLAVAAAAGILLRLAAVLWIPTQPVSDFWGYYHRGLNLAEFGRYEAIAGRKDATHPPLYPLLLAGAFRIAPGHTLAEAKVVNCLLGGIAVAAAGLLGRRIFGAGAGLIAAWLMAVFPRSVILACLLASENLFAPLLLLYVWIVLEASTSSRSIRRAGLAGLVLALLSLTRTVAHYLSFLWPLAAIAGRRRLGTIAAGTALLLAVQHAVMLPWALRNQRAIGQFTFLNTGGGYGLFLGNNPNATGLWYDGREDLERVAPGVHEKGALAVSDASNEAAWKWIRENPGKAFALYLKKFRIIFQQTYVVESFAVSGRNIEPPKPGRDVLPGPHFLKEHPHLLTRTLWITGWLLAIFGLLGCLVLFRRWLRTRSPDDLAIALVMPAAAFYVPIVSSLIAVNGRYRWPVEDLLMPCAALFLASTFEALRRPREAARPAIE
jgi:4-amino-4-deoxy-L-arabinose transferase-like glycosyltransferase